MPSIFARFRNRNRQPSTQSVPSQPATQHDPHDVPDVLPPLDRKIRPDISTLLEAYATEDATSRTAYVSNKISSVNEELGLNPLKPRSTGRLLRKKEPHETTAATPVSSTWARPSVPQVLKAPPRGGTFGRHSQNLLVSTRSTAFNSLPSRTRPSDEKENDHSFWKKRPSTAPSPQNRVIGLPETPSVSSENAQTDPSFKSSVRSRSSSTKTQSSRSWKSRSARISTPVANQLGFDSPRTLGYPSPPSIRAPRRRLTGSPPPPLPPLVHQEHATMSQSSTFGKSVRPYSSLPKANSFFSAPTSGEPGFGGRYSHPRANTLSSMSTKASRRSSAEWSANQATSGVLSNSGSWPAEVARAIIRSSFGSQIDVGHQDPDTTTRGSHVVDTIVQETLDATFLQQSVLPSSLGQSLIQSTEPVPDLLNSVGDHVVIGEDSGGMGEYDRKIQDASSGQLSATTKGKTPLKKSSLRMSSPPVSFPSTSHSGPFISFAGVTAELLASESHSKSSNSTGLRSKRKADEVDVVSSDQKRTHAKFSVAEEKPRQGSADHHAPSSYRVKRARLSASTPNPSPSRTGHSSDAVTTGSLNSVASSLSHLAARQQPGSRSGSVRSTPAGSDRVRTPHRPRSPSSLSHVSIPLSALVSPHAPSVSRSLNNTYHMRDPRKPPKTQSTSWGLRFRTDDENGSPIHAWFFFVGFVFFPIWWVASVWSIPKTRQVGIEDIEKAVTLDDPQVEHDAKSWRFRCRVMSAVSIFTYIPFIVLVAIFVPH